MEVVEACQEKCRFSAPTTRQNQPTNVKIIKKYVQPPRAKPLKPSQVYCPPKNPIDIKTTYHSSYYNENQLKQARPKPILPVHNINRTKDKFNDDTTTKKCFQPVWGIHKAKPILPHQRIRTQKVPMENVTTIQHDYAPKYIPKTEAILPCLHIRTSKGMFEGTTTTLTSFVNPGPVEPVTSCKPPVKYCKAQEPLAKETTQKLSFLPYQIGRKENYPWAMKPSYRRPETMMLAETTYTNSYLDNKIQKEKPILPRDAGVLPRGSEFMKNTIYKESFLPRKVEHVEPIIPAGNISPSKGNMASDTTSKLSFQPIKGEKRKPILPRRRKILTDAGFNENVTTNQLSFTPKITKRTKMILPSTTLNFEKEPLEDKTTTAASYPNPGPTTMMPSFKPVLSYNKPEAKMAGETMNKLSYQEWTIEPKETLPWAQKHPYQRPKEKIASDTVYHSSFPPPGYFVEENEIDECTCSSEDR